MRNDHDTEKGAMDREINLRAIVYTTVGLAVIMVVCAAIVWPLLRGFYSMVVSADPPPPALAEARAPVVPPEPRLQPDPVADMDTLRAEETRLLTSWEWVDEASGRARVPVERAMEILVENGLDAPAAPAVAVPAETAETTEDSGE